MIVTLQIQLDPESIGKSNFMFSKEQLEIIQGHMYECCSKLEKLSYVRYEMYVDGKSYTP